MAKDTILPTSLPGEINVATRSLHTSLNRLITARLPLALPPNAPNSSLYTTGLLHFAHVYMTFESLWTDLVPAPSDPPSSPMLSFLLVNPYDAPEMFSTPPSPQMIQFLQTLRPKGLARSGRLKRDLEFLTGLHPTDLSVLLAQYPGDKVQEFCSHIRKAIKHKPHVLVAYAWCFYMAVFSGGRWIRGELVKAGEDFWQSARENGVEKVKFTGWDNQGLAFWNFGGDQDGEDIKTEFKRRLALAEKLFTPDERVDVIEEAKEIFKLSVSLVDELDEKIGTNMDKLSRVAASAPHQGKGQAAPDHRVGEKASQAETLWFQRPEVTGTVIALGCLACAAACTFDLGDFF